MLGMIAGIITAFTMIQGAPELDEENLMLTQAMQVFDQNNEFVSQLDSSERRINVRFQDIPSVVEDAFTSVEDVRFRQHFGIDIRRLFGAIVANIREGFGAEGASTITQQLVKNLFLNDQKQLTRKVQEQYLAIQLEQKYSKDQILEMYLNQINLSNGIYGVELASQKYFSKSVSELNLEDAALLAAIPRRPSFYDPINNPENAESRRNLVLSLMEQHGKITADEAEAAKAIPIGEQLNVSETTEAYPYEAFYNQVLSELEEMDGITINDIYNAGLEVYTTLDVNAQEHVDNVLQTDDFISSYPDNEDFQAGVTLLDTKTGQIKALGSGLEDTDIQRGFNYATDIKKQPGSTIKPILDYGPAIEHLQWSTAHILVDEPHQYNTGDEIRNFDRAHGGSMSMREALARSRNVTAIKALQEVGVERAAEFGKGLGIPIDADPMHEAYGLGGFETGFSSLELAAAFAAFGNNGQFTEPYTVRKIVFPDGREIDTTPDSSKAMEDYTAYMITDMLKSAVSGPNGTGASANIPGLPLAGKTGTTNFDEEVIRQYNLPDRAVPDVWFSGYTTNYTAAVWAGYTKNGDNNYLGTPEDRRLAQLIFKAIMEEVSSGVETADFAKPDSVVEIPVERSTGLLPSAFTPSSEIVTELFVRGHEPSQVSEKFADDIPAPTGLKASYEEDSNQIIVTWDYPSDQIENVTFELTMSVNGGDKQTVQSSKDMQFILSEPEPESTYRFEVIAISDEDSSNRSDSASVEVTVTRADEEEEDESDEDEDNDNDEDEEDDTTEPGDGEQEEEDDEGEEQPENPEDDNQENDNGNNGNPDNNGNDDNNENQGNGNDEVNVEPEQNTGDGENENE